jgi:hypothetical protein
MTRLSPSCRLRRETHHGRIFASGTQISRILTPSVRVLELFEEKFGIRRIHRRTESLRGLQLSSRWLWTWLASRWSGKHSIWNLLERHQPNNKKPSQNHSEEKSGNFFLSALCVKPGAIQPRLFAPSTILLSK